MRSSAECEIIDNDVEELENLFIEMATLQYQKLNTIIENARYGIPRVISFLSM